MDLFQFSLVTAQQSFLGMFRGCNVKISKVVQPSYKTAPYSMEKTPGRLQSCIVLATVKFGVKDVSPWYLKK